MQQRKAESAHTPALGSGVCLELPDCGSLECLAGVSVRCQMLIIHKTEGLELKALAFFGCVGGDFGGVLLFFKLSYAIDANPRRLITQTEFPDTVEMLQSKLGITWAGSSAALLPHRAALTVGPFGFLWVP